jgi:hypothetical protein
VFLCFLLALTVPLYCKLLLAFIIQSRTSIKAISYPIIWLFVGLPYLFRLVYVDTKSLFEIMKRTNHEKVFENKRKKNKNKEKISKVQISLMNEVIKSMNELMKTIDTKSKNYIDKSKIVRKNNKKLSRTYSILEEINFKKQKM